MNIEGVIPIWKPVGKTSHDVVAKARRILGLKRIGHTGTLDPMVTGVLPLCLGRATRLVEYIQELPKEYEAKLVIGHATDTEDITGSVIRRVSGIRLAAEQVRQAIQEFIGDIEQVPPMYSAVKVDGTRLYELARSGVTVERKARRVTVHDIHIMDMNLELPEPEIALRIRCSKGTYIRTLCTDIGHALGYPAVMAGLVRTAAGGMTRTQCVTLEELAEAKDRGQEALVPYIIQADDAVSFFPSVHVGEKMASDALQGKKLQLPEDFRQEKPQVELPGNMQALKRLYAPGGVFLGLFRLQEDGRILVPEKVFMPVP